MARRQRPTTTGIIVIDKPIGLSSMGVVRVVRGKARGAKTGHAGTLDPLATGVLVVCLGRATKTLGRIMETRKRYLAEVDLSAFTSTDDREGEREEVHVEQPPNRAVVERTVQRFVGEIEQTPSMYSAVKINGVRAYRLARKGIDAPMPSRQVTVYSIDVCDYAWPIVTLDVRCGKGTYVRSLARDIGRALGTGGHLAALRRTAVGDFTIDRAVLLDDVPEPLTEEHLLPISVLDAPGGNAR
ncbi:MAG: tRNA pseudouridine(55) synthase TruB [Phycisphaerales bacterium]|nr:tRNA pseudouridine(55) synthase TruB [Phycisphaerales bacterium]